MNVKKILCIILAAVMVLTLVGCGTKRESGHAPHVMTIVDETAGYTIYKHDQTGVWYFCRDAGYGKSVCVMVNADGTPYTGG